VPDRCQHELLARGYILLVDLALSGGLLGLDLLAAAAPRRLGQLAPQRQRQREAGEREHDERSAPRDQRGDFAAHDEAEPSSERLTAQDQAVHAPALARREVVPHE
jgi:hypothetical protein